MIFVKAAMKNIPLSLYIHIPWCVRKCPYCDFNSHESSSQSSIDQEDEYIKALMADWDNDKQWLHGRQLQSIFIGGGTPSLFSAQAYQKIFDYIQKDCGFSQDIEITLEANPGTVEQEKFNGYRQAGINRLSIGVQSFHPEHLKKLGRIHSSDEAIKALRVAREAGFDNVNLDLMFGLPAQTIEEALSDLQTAINLKPNHLSWYQLTIEPNTVFYRQKPALPDEEIIWDMQEKGQALLASNQYLQYEVSAYAQTNKQSRHNYNYWEFGDYLAIGAGAHGKISMDDGVFRMQKTRLPKDYLNGLITNKFIASSGFVAQEELAFEFLLNALRLKEGINSQLFFARTGLLLQDYEKKWLFLKNKGLLMNSNERIQCTETGYHHLNYVLQEFLA